jgi:hypothetical protein
MFTKYVVIVSLPRFSYYHINSLVALKEAIKLNKLSLF